MAKVVRMDEKAILTVAEKKILEKAYEILDEIYDECEQGEDLEIYARDARNELGSFLEADGIYEVENENTDTVKIIIEL